MKEHVGALCTVALLASSLPYSRKEVSLLNR